MTPNRARVGASGWRTPGSAGMFKAGGFYAVRRVDGSADVLRDERRAIHRRRERGLQSACGTHLVAPALTRGAFPVARVATTLARCANDPDPSTADVAGGWRVK